MAVGIGIFSSIGGKNLDDLRKENKKLRKILKEARDVIYNAIAAWNEEYYTEILNKIDGVLKNDF